VGGLDEKVNDPILWELFLQAGPVGKKHLQCLLFMSLFLTMAENILIYCKWLLLRISNSSLDGTLSQVLSHTSCTSAMSRYLSGPKIFMLKVFTNKLTGFSS
jgi:hypothetical protein